MPVLTHAGPAAAIDLAWLRARALALGFADVGVADVDLADAEAGLRAWIDAGMHGEMRYFDRHGLSRARAADIVPGTVSAVMAVMDYAPSDPDWIEQAWHTLATADRAYVSRYALGRDYHKVVRARLGRLADALRDAVGPFGHRVFCDSAPVLEVELATRAGLGWRGKHTLLLAPRDGSMRFIGTLYTDLPIDAALPAAVAPQPDRCGTCGRCIDACPTAAIIAPGRLDARRCISYLTIEQRGDIPVALRPAIGNRIYGCDDCQLACPWNRFASAAPIDDFAPRNRLDVAGLVELFGWSADDFDRRLAGSAIRRIGHACWQRNLAVAMGNALRAPAGDDAASGSVGPRARAAIVGALRGWLARPDAQRDPMVERHVAWALAQDGAGAASPA